MQGYLSGHFFCRDFFYIGKFQVEAHIYWPQKELFEFCKKNNITFTAYGPIGSPGRKVFNPESNWPEGEPMKDPLVLELAKKYNKTPAQVFSSIHILYSRSE